MKLAPGHFCSSGVKKCLKGIFFAFKGTLSWIVCWDIILRYQTEDIIWNNYFSFNLLFIWMKSGIRLKSKKSVAKFEWNKYFPIPFRLQCPLITKIWLVRYSSENNPRCHTISCIISYHIISYHIKLYSNIMKRCNLSWTFKYFFSFVFVFFCFVSFFFSISFKKKTVATFVNLASDNLLIRGSDVSFWQYLLP